MILGAAVVSCAGRGAETGGSRHAIVVLDIGTLRADHLGCYGYHRDTSPNIDALAEESVRFEWAFSQAPSTLPAQTSLLTGLYPGSHGVITGQTRLPEEAVTLADVLSQNGFATAAFVDGGYMSGDFGLDQGFGHYDNASGAGLEEIGPKAIAWMREHSGESFLLLVHTYDLHTPYAPQQPFRGMFLAGLEAPSPGFEPTAEAMEAIRQAAEAGDPEPLPPHDLEYAEALYDGQIRALDEWVGRFVGAFRELGLDERATLVLVSDHGEEFQEHDTVLHDKLYATVTRVPLLLRFPGGRHAGTVSQIVESLDLMPTLLDVVGAPEPPGIQGESLLPLVRGEAAPPYLAFGETPLSGEQRSVALGGYHMLLTKESRSVELYNLLADPLELNDLAETEADRIGVLRRHLESWQKTVASAALGAEQAVDSMDQETLENLRTLGYIQ